MSAVMLPRRGRRSSDDLGLAEARAAVQDTRQHAANTRARWPYIKQLADRAERAASEIASQRAENHFAQDIRDALGGSGT